MEIKFLGTASGAPSRQRNVSATAIMPDQGKHWVLVDCGEATQHQLLRTSLSPQKVSAVLITHIHGDHCYGLPGLLASCQLNGRKDPLVLVGPDGVWEYLQSVMRFTELQINYPLEFIPVSEDLCIELAGMRITAHTLSHRVPSWAYRMEEIDIPRRLDVAKLQAEGIPSGPHYAQLQQGLNVDYPVGVDRIDEPGLKQVARRLLKSDEYAYPSWQARVIVIGGDNDRPELLTGACRDANLLIHEATYTQDMLEHVGPEPQHSSAELVARFAQRQGLNNLILTHFSPRYLASPTKKRDRGIAEIEQEARAHYQGTLFLANDFDQYCLDRSGRLFLVGV